MSPGGVVPDERSTYTAPDRLPPNDWALAGEWTVGPQATELATAGGRITYRFHARDLNLVMGARDTPVRFQVTLDGEPPGAAHGLDIDEAGNGTAAEPRLYQLVRQPVKIGERTFEITFGDPGAQAYVFTFG